MAPTPATSPITSDFQDDSGLLPLDSPATMDQYIMVDRDLLLGDPLDLPLLSLPLLPVPVADVSGPVSVATLSGSQFCSPQWCRRTCLRRAPLMWIRPFRGRRILFSA